MEVEVYDNFKPMACQGLALSYFALHVFLACFKCISSFVLHRQQELDWDMVSSFVASLDGLTLEISRHFSQERGFYSAIFFPDCNDEF